MHHEYASKVEDMHAKFLPTKNISYFLRALSILVLPQDYSVLNRLP